MLVDSILENKKTPTASSNRGLAHTKPGTETRLRGSDSPPARAPQNGETSETEAAEGAGGWHLGERTTEGIAGFARTEGTVELEHIAEIRLGRLIRVSVGVPVA